MRVVFMGTPEIAAMVLGSLIGSRHEVAAVVTQPDKPNSRGNAVIYSPVKQLALEHDIPVLQPIKASSEESVAEIASYEPDIIVVAAYGQILRENLLNLPKYRCINVHASLLPQYRGASPIQWAVINGDEETGISIMYMEKGLDTGDVILQKSLKLDPDETAGSLHDRLGELAGPVLLEAMDMIENGTADPVPQDDSQSSYVSMLDKSMGELDFTKNSEELERLIRGLIPWPGAYTRINGKMLKIWKAAVGDVKGLKPGEIYTAIPGELYIGTGDGSLNILELQLEGRKRMFTSDFLRGFKVC
ncbi:MAG: methionyl-tRNA formyltransferase [Lachnospiraceae bacterium]|nr:methionyl-tRNA formyltransferase [Lachnospiraceae bacterium]